MRDGRSAREALIRSEHTHIGANLARASGRRAMAVVWFLPNSHQYAVWNGMSHVLMSHIGVWCVSAHTLL